MKPVVGWMGAVVRRVGRARAQRRAAGQGSAATPGSAAAPAATLPPDVAYDLWAPVYGSPPTRLQEIEAIARARLLPELRGGRVLDLGCGTGRIVLEALGRGAGFVVGLDRSWAMLARAAGGGVIDDCSAAVARAGAAPAGRRDDATSDTGAVTGGNDAPAAKGGLDREGGRERLLWIQGEAARLPLRDGAFDVVISALVLGHVTDLDGAIAEMDRVLAPGGTLLLSDFHPEAAQRGWERTFADPGSGRTYRVEHRAHPMRALMEALARRGLEVSGSAEPAHEGTPVVFVLRARKASSASPAVAAGSEASPRPGPGR